LRDRPPREKQAWRALFDHYVFGDAQRAGEHLPPQARKVLGPIDETLARQLRAMLINKLNR
ncbi:MAG TPA: cupin-like domain-containing protein, partial [Pseudoxanthomonas sp.]|nr:cupin-like domain-containing protein [Pseudoxanthomonas sp.]